MSGIDRSQEWMDRAKSHLIRASLSPKPKGVLYEDLCYDCQQSAEKVMKAALGRERTFPEPIPSISCSIFCVNPGWKSRPFSTSYPT